MICVDYKWPIQIALQTLLKVMATQEQAECLVEGVFPLPQHKRQCNVVREKIVVANLLRMDSDDISKSNRCEEEFKLFDKNPELDIVEICRVLLVQLL